MTLSNLHKNIINTVEVMIKVSINNFALLYLQKYSECSLRKKAVFSKQTNDFTFDKEDFFQFEILWKIHYTFWNLWIAKN